MKEISMTGRELIFISSMLGGESFFGLQDPFFGMEDYEIRAELQEIQVSLDEKGFIELGFDDTLAINSDIEALVRNCTFCEKYLIVNAIENGVIHPQEVYYLKDGEIILLVDKGEQIKLTPVNFRQLEDKLAKSFYYEGDDYGEAFEVTSQELVDIQNSQDGMPLEQLTKLGCTGKMADILLKGLQQKALYCSITGADLKKRSMVNFTSICSPEGMIEMRLNEEYEDKWVISFMKQESLRCFIRKFGEDYANV